MVKKFHLAVCQLAKSCEFNKNLNSNSLKRLFYLVVVVKGVLLPLFT